MKVKPNKQTHPRRTVTKEKIDKILDRIKLGSAIKHACLRNSVSEHYFYELVNQGICDIEHDVEDTLARYLAVSLNEIQDDEIVSCKSDIRDSDKSHKGAEWILERSYWRYFSSNVPIMELEERMKKLEKENK